MVRTYTYRCGIRSQNRRVGFVYRNIDITSGWQWAWAVTTKAVIACLVMLAALVWKLCTGIWAAPSVTKRHQASPSSRRSSVRLVALPRSEGVGWVAGKEGFLVEDGWTERERERKREIVYIHIIRIYKIYIYIFIYYIYIYLYIHYTYIYLYL